MTNYTKNYNAYSLPEKMEMQTASELFDNILVQTDALDNSSMIKRCQEILRKYDVLCIRGLVKYKVADEIIEKIYEFKDAAPLNNGFRNEEDFQKISQKCVVGGNIYDGSYNPRAQRIIYIPTNTDPFASIFETQVKCRNLLYGYDADFTIKPNKDYFSASRVHHYPQGGGFLFPHQDRSATVVSSNNPDEYFQVSCTLSKKGTDYKHGGGYIVYNDEIFNFDDFTEKGDIVVYNGHTLHGVQEIDPLEVFDFNKSNGRLASFVTLYKRNY